MPAGFEFLRASARRGLITAINEWNDNVNALAERYGSTSGLPRRISFADAESIVVDTESYEDFKDLLDTFNSGSGWDIDPDTGNIKFLDAELKKAVEQVKRMRDSARLEAFPEWELLAPFEKIKAMASGNIAPVTGEYTRPEDLTMLLKWYQSEQVGSYIESYLASVVEYMEPIYDIVETAIYNIIAIAGDRYLKAIFDRGYVETQIEYVYPQKGSAFAGVSDAKRLKDVREFWMEQERIARESKSQGKRVEIDEHTHGYKAGRGRNISRTVTRTSASWV